MHLCTQYTRNIKIHLLPFTIITILFLAIIVSSFTYYFDKFNSYQYRYTQNTLNQMASQVDLSWKQYTSQKFQLLTSISIALSSQNDSTGWEQQLDSYEQQLHTPFGLVPEDYFLSQISKSLPESVKLELESGHSVYEVFNYSLNQEMEESLIFFFIPLPPNEGHYSAIYTTAPAQDLKTVLSLDNFNTSCQLYLLTREGDIINSDVQKSNSFTFNSKNTKENIQKNMEENQSFFYSYSYNHNNLYAYYHPVSLGKWYFLLTVSSAELVEPSHSLRVSFRKIFLVVLFSVIFYFICIFIMNYRLKNFQSRSEQLLSLSQKGYKTIAAESDSDIYEYNTSDHTITHTVNYKKILGFDPITKSFPQAPIVQGIVHPDDVKKFLTLFDAQKKFHLAEIRLKGADGVYIWCQMTSHTLYDDVGFPLLIMGRITDITEIKIQANQLIEKAQVDSLTKAYNKVTTHELIALALKKSRLSQSHALFLIDVDNFKTINDCYGHIAGDTILSEIGRALQSVFRKDDIIGRIGGDEFMVFLKDTPCQDLISQKGNDILEAFSKIKIPQNSDHLISGSIGISIYPQHGKTYEELYKHADEAMYHSKEYGKATFTIYKS